MTKIAGVMAAVLAVAGVFILDDAGRATAASELPPDVREFFDEQALDVLLDAGHGVSVEIGPDEPDFSIADRLGEAQEVFTWSAEFIAGRETTAPVETLHEWVSAAYDGDTLVGTISAFRPSPDSRAELAGYNNDLVLGRAVEGLSDDAILVTDPPSGSLYSLSGGSLIALNDPAAFETSGTTTLAEFQPIIAERYANDIAMAGNSEDSVGGGHALEDRRPWVFDVPAVVGGVALIVVGLGIGAFAIFRRRRRMLG